MTCEFTRKQPNNGRWQTLTLPSGRQCTYCLFPSVERTHASKQREETKRRRGTTSGVHRVSFNSGYLARKANRPSPLRIVVPWLMALETNWELCFPGAEGKHVVPRVPGEDFVPRHWRKRERRTPSGRNVRGSNIFCNRFPRRLTREATNTTPLKASREAKQGFANVSLRSSHLSIKSAKKEKRQFPSIKEESPYGLPFLKLTPPVDWRSCLT